MTGDQSKRDGGKPAAKTAREQRLAVALRANLTRRKAAARPDPAQAKPKPRPRDLE
jgi:hypothetical protein